MARHKPHECTQKLTHQVAATGTKSDVYDVLSVSTTGQRLLFRPKILTFGIAYCTVIINMHTHDENCYSSCACAWYLAELSANHCVFAHNLSDGKMLYTVCAHDQK